MKNGLIMKHPGAITFLSIAMFIMPTVCLIAGIFSVKILGKMEKG